jgi:hypothetical protein
MTFEEGMTRAAEIEVMSRIPEGGGYFDLHHSYTYDVYYEALNDRRIGAAHGSFFAGDDALFLMRYQLSSYAWSKAAIERPSFFAKFNAALYAKALTDPSAPCTESTLTAIAAKAAPRVEGRPFLAWYASQGVLDTHPPVGDILYQRINQFGIDLFSRDTQGHETPHPNVTINWQARDFAHQPIASGSDSTTSLGWIAPPPQIPAQYTGRVEMIASATAPNTTALNDTVLRTAHDGAGVFGAVPRDLPATITVTATSPRRRVTTTTVNGAFDLPSLALTRGRLRALITYSDGVRLTRTFTKDASNYYLRVPISR